MSKDTLIAVFISLAVHVAVALSERPAVKAPSKPLVEEPRGYVALTLPPEEPEPVESSGENAPQESVVSYVPQLVDVPRVAVDVDFTQTVQPILPPPENALVATKPLRMDSTVTAKTVINKVFELASVDQKPEVRFKVDPSYPPELARARLSGEVLVGFVVDRDGNVREPYIVKATHSGFEGAVLQAIVRWKFKPGRKDGSPVNTRVELPLAFTKEV